METPTAFLSGPSQPGMSRSARTVPPDRGTGPPAVAVDDDTATFSAFYRGRWRAIASGLALTLGDRELGAEATDEAMVRAYSRWSTIRSYDNPAGWVYRVGLNWARSHHRRAARLVPFIGQHDRAGEDALPDPAIGEALLELDVKHRAVVVCRLLLDWSVDETAAALDIAPGTVKSRLHRALHLLQPALDAEGDQP